MAGHDIIVIGGSAGSVEALCTVLAGLPADLPAAVCVVLHQSAYSPNRRPEIFSRATRLPVVLAEQGMRLRPGTVYLSVQDMHLLIERSSTAELGVLRLVRGPKENRSRPAVDPLFRTAALAFGRRVIGVVLSGALDDGTSGLWVIKDRGGIAVVQDPVDAAVSSMPSHAIEEVGADHIAPAKELGALLGELARTAISGSRNSEGESGYERPVLVGDSPEPTDELEREVRIGALDDDAHEREERYGVPSRFACPDCGGVLWATNQGGGPLHFRCETGHAYSAASLAEAQSEAIEAAMWAALRALEDKTELARLRAGLARERGLDAHAQQFEVQLEAAMQHASAVRSLLRMDGGSGIRPAVPGRQEGLSDQGGDKPASRGSPVKYSGKRANG
jgi:two-component system chemotaxis response regulator CheB